MLLLGHRLFDQAEEKLREVADDDEGWGQCWTTVVFHNQIVSLELPKDVCVTLHHLECVAANGRETKREKELNMLGFFLILSCTKKSVAYVDSYRQTDKQMEGFLDFHPLT